jgi:hypothetical protein
MNVWFVSPALFPLFISFAIMILGTVLGIHAIREGGAKKFFEDLSQRQRDSSDRTLRFFGILLVICAYVYLNVPRVDFFLSTLFCLVVFITLFYFDEAVLLKRLTLIYFIGNLLFLTFFIVGMDKILNERFPYFTDVLVLLFIIVYVLYCRILIRGNEILIKKFKVTLIVSLLVPLILVPAFKYLLLVPLPVEGGIIELMNIVRYAFR